MKLLKRLFFVLALALLVVLPVSCIQQGAHVHQYGEWTMTVEPTETTPGKAVRTCTVDGHEMKMSVAILTDTSVWTVDEEKSVAPTCQTEGKVVYTSAFGTVEVVKATTEHEFTSWEITVEPTLTAPGKVTRTCKYGETEEAELAVLTDTTVWTVKEHVGSTCQVEGKDVYTCAYGDVTVVLPKVDHQYDEWILTVEPTMTTTGTAERICSVSGERDSVEVAVLTDTSVWELVDQVNPTCQEIGAAVYKSIYAEIKVVLPKAEHQYGEWTLTVNPTMDAVGKAERTCVYGETEEVEVAVLTDTSVWTVEEVEPTYTKEGATIYKSIYGEVSFAVEKLVPPFIGTTYHAFEIHSRYNFGVIKPLAMASVNVTFDENGTTIATSTYPFSSITTVAIVNEETGEISFTSGSNVYKGHMDFESGVMIRAWGSSYSDTIVLVPTDSTITLSNCTGASWDQAVAFEYNDGTVVCSAFIYQENAYFGVSFEDEKGTKLAASDCATAPVVYVKDAKGTVIEAFVNNGTTLVVSDKLEGTYKDGETTLVVSGYGEATLNGVDGTYVKAGETDAFTITLTVDGTYYEVTLKKEDYTCKVVKPMVTITFDAAGKAEVAPMEVNKNVVVVLPTPENATEVFKGWYYDAAFTKAVEEEFVPTENVTLYAKWAEKVVINLVGVLEGDPTQLLLGVGDVIGDFLPEYTTNLDIMKQFAGWYLDAEFTTTLPMDVVLTLDDTNTIIYAKWVDLPAYVGNYVGVEVWGKD